MKAKSKDIAPIYGPDALSAQILEVFQQGSLGEEVEDLPEATLMEKMQHPNVMRTYKHATRAKHPSASKAQHLHFGDSDETSGYMLETWLLLEACNKGSLQACTFPLPLHLLQSTGQNSAP